MQKQQQSPVGMWVTRDGYIRRELKPDGRYYEARGEKKSTAHSGRYIVKGNHINYSDDAGFTATGDFINGILYHGGYVFYNQSQVSIEKLNAQILL